MEIIQEKSTDSNLHDKSLNPNFNKSEIYDKWADTYDAYVNNLNYQGPDNLARELSDFLDEFPNRHLKILDFGCGTGLLGLAINKKLGGIYFFDIDGIDISEKMIQKSHEKNVYRRIWQLDLFKEILPQQHQYDVIVSSGVFLEGHVSFKMIDILLNSLNPFGYIFFTLRETFKNKTIKDYTKYVIDNPRIEIIHDFSIQYLPDVKCKLVIGKKLF
jgi:predicted TPR repeat methyltransferase